MTGHSWLLALLSLLFLGSCVADLDSCNIEPYPWQVVLCGDMCEGIYMNTANETVVLNATAESEGCGEAIKKIEMLNSEREVYEGD